MYTVQSCVRICLVWYSLEFKLRYKLIYRKVCGLHTLHKLGASVFTVARSFNMIVLQTSHSCDPASLT